MIHLHSPLHRTIARLLAIIVLVLGIMAPTVTLAETIEDCAHKWCVSFEGAGHPVAIDVLMTTDMGEEFSDLEQLLSPQPGSALHTIPAWAGFQPPAVLPPGPARPPLLRPPSFPV